MLSEKKIASNKPLSFLIHGLRSPRFLGAIAPSSQVSAAVIAKQVDLGKPGYVIELGGGTGSISNGLLEHGLAEERLLIIERDLHFVRILRKRFPRVKVIHGDAVNLLSLLKEHGIRAINAIVSVLPLLSLKASVRDEIVAQVFQALDKGQCFIQLTYGRHSPVPQRFIEEFHFSSQVVARVWRNIPPARIWR